MATKVLLKDGTIALRDGKVQLLRDFSHGGNIARCTCCESKHCWYPVVTWWLDGWSDPVIGTPICSPVDPGTGDWEVGGCQAIIWLTDDSLCAIVNECTLPEDVVLDIPAVPDDLPSNCDCHVCDGLTLRGFILAFTGVAINGHAAFSCTLELRFTDPANCGENCGEFNGRCGGSALGWGASDPPGVVFFPNAPECQGVFVCEDNGITISGIAWDTFTVMMKYSAWSGFGVYVETWNTNEGVFYSYEHSTVSTCDEVVTLTNDFTGYGQTINGSGNSVGKNGTVTITPIYE